MVHAATEALRAAVGQLDAESGRNAAAAGWHVEPLVRFLCSTYGGSITWVRVKRGQLRRGHGRSLGERAGRGDACGRTGRHVRVPGQHGPRAGRVRADAAAEVGALGPGQRWSAGRKREVVLRLLRGESFDVLSREVGVESYRQEAWKARALAGLELGLQAQAGEPLAAELDAAKRHIGELSMHNELLRERARAAERRLPLPMRRSRR